MSPTSSTTSTPTSTAAQSRFDCASRALGLRLEGRPAQVVTSASVEPWLAEATAAAQALSDAIDAGERRVAVPHQVAVQRLAGWRPAAERAAAVASDATPTDVALADLLTRARLVLHRYARHFGGQHRSTRDLGRLAEARVALVSLTRQAQPLAAAATDPVLQQEARALPRFIEFLVQEQGEISDNLAASGRLDQARALGAIAATLEEGWLAEVVPVHRLARRPGLLERYVHSLTEVHDRMGAVRHANLPDAHERAIETVAGWLVQWQAEWDQTVAERARAGKEACANALAEHVQALWQVVVTEVAEGTQGETMDSLRARCDLLDEVLTQRAIEATEATAATDAAPQGPAETGSDQADLAQVIPAPGLAGIQSAVPRAEDVRDALIWLGQRYDQLANPA